VRDDKGEGEGEGEGEGVVVVVVVIFLYVAIPRGDKYWHGHQRPAASNQYRGGESLVRER
jgi:hypothetical protein